MTTAVDTKTVNDYLDDHWFQIASGGDGDPSFSDLLEAMNFDPTPEIARAKTVIALLERARNRQELAAKLEELQNSKELPAAKKAIQKAREEAEAAQASLDAAWDQLHEAESNDADDAEIERLQGIAQNLKVTFPERLKAIRAKEFAAHSVRVELEQAIDEITQALQAANDAFCELGEVKLLPLHIRRKVVASPRLEQLNQKRSSLAGLITKGEVLLRSADPTKRYSNNDPAPEFSIDEFVVATGGKVFSGELWQRPAQYSGEFDWQVIGSPETFQKLRDHATAELSRLRSELRSVVNKIEAANNRACTDRDYYRDRL